MEGLEKRISEKEEESPAPLNKSIKEIIVSDKEGEVLAVISDTEVIEKNGIDVTINFI